MTKKKMSETAFLLPKAHFLKNNLDNEFKDCTLTKLACLLKICFTKKLFKCIYLF